MSLKLKAQPCAGDKFTIFTVTPDEVQVSFSAYAPPMEGYTYEGYVLVLSTAEGAQLQDFMIDAGLLGLEFMQRLLNLKRLLSEISTTEKMTHLEETFRDTDVKIRSKAIQLKMRTHLKECECCTKSLSEKETKLCKACSDGIANIEAFRRSLMEQTAQGLGLSPSGGPGEKGPTKH